MDKRIDLSSAKAKIEPLDYWDYIEFENDELLRFDRFNGDRMWLHVTGDIAGKVPKNKNVIKALMELGFNSSQLVV